MFFGERKEGKCYRVFWYGVRFCGRSRGGGGFLELYSVGKGFYYFVLV